MENAFPLSRRFQGTKFLYVDDEPDNLAGFRFHLENHFEVITSSDPLAALEMIKNEPQLAVLVVDQVMPKMTGLALALEAKKISPTITCLMITGNATKQLAVESIRSRVFWEFLEKPVNFGAPEAKQLLVNAIQQHLLEKIKTDYRCGTIELLSKLIDDKDGHTQRHSQRVTEWAVKIAKKFNLSERELVMVREGALLHDIGKVSIPDDILKKPGRLSELERKIIMTHPGRGGDLLEKIPQLNELASMARDHHERPDGKGYPRGLQKGEIPLLASIVAMADFYEALSSKRPYKDPWPIPEIIKEVIKVRGTQFPEEVVDVLFLVLEEEGAITQEEIVALCKGVAA